MQCIDQKNNFFCICSMQIISKFHLVQRGEFRLLLLHHPARLHPPTQAKVHDFVLVLIFFKRNFKLSILQKLSLMSSNFCKNFALPLYPKAATFVPPCHFCVIYIHNKCPLPLSNASYMVVSGLGGTKKFPSPPPPIRKKRSKTKPNHPCNLQWRHFTDDVRATYQRNIELILFYLQHLLGMT
jgi:hypothetical protein